MIEHYITTSDPKSRTVEALAALDAPRGAPYPPRERTLTGGRPLQ